MEKNFYAKGKLLLSSEFMILHGAKAIALPLKVGQWLKLQEKKDAAFFTWSAAYANEEWFSMKLSSKTMELIETNDRPKAEQLIRIFQKMLFLKPGFKTELSKYNVLTELEFDPAFGFGSSSSLTSLLAQWAELDPLQLHFHISKGSGYDVACATATSPIIYQYYDDMPVTEAIEFDPSFKDKLWLVYLGKKQDSQASVANFLQNYHPVQTTVEYFSSLSLELLASESLKEFEAHIEDHEKELSAILGIPTLKELRFPDLEGFAKSLGAWGGDFALIGSEWEKEQLLSYLNSRGIEQLYAYKDLVI